MRHLVTPAAVGRGEREVKPAAWLVRNDWGVRLFLTQGAAERCANEASVEEGTTSVQPLYAALPPDAGGEDGERLDEDDARVLYGMEALEDAALALERMRGVIRDAEVNNYTDWLRGRARALRRTAAARRSATERSGGGRDD